VFGIFFALYPTSQHQVESHLQSQKKGNPSGSLFL